MRLWFAIVALLLVQGMVGCDDSSPVAPSVSGVSSVTPLAVTSLTPKLGSTGGGTQVKIGGTSLASTVTFGGIPVQGRFFSGNPTMYLSAPAHSAGTVDVVVSGQGGQSVTLTDAYTYTSPQTFDFNGDWTSVGETDHDGDVSFTIRDNLLRTVSCGPDLTLTFSPARPITNGEFAFVRDDGVDFSGRIVGVSDATGTIRLGACEFSAWRAQKR
jgi:hypothetical protein